MKLSEWLARSTHTLFGLFDPGRWSIFCGVRSLELHHLTRAELQLVLLTLSSSEKSETYLHRQGWSTWLNLKDARLPVSKFHARWLGKGNAHVEVDGVLPPQNASAADITQLGGKAKIFRERHHARHAVQLPLKISSHQNEFETETLDVSEGGILIRDPLPDWAAGYLYCVIEIAHDHQIALVCSLVEDQEARKTRLETVTNQSQGEFLAWLRSDSRFKKTAGLP